MIEKLKRSFLVYLLMNESIVKCIENAYRFTGKHHNFLLLVGNSQFSILFLLLLTIPFIWFGVLYLTIVYGINKLNDDQFLPNLIMWCIWSRIFNIYDPLVSIYKKKWPFLCYVDHRILWTWNIIVLHIYW